MFKDILDLFSTLWTHHSYLGWSEHVFEAKAECFRKWWPELELNQRHKDFQSSALPTELSGHANESRKI